MKRKKQRETEGKKDEKNGKNNGICGYQHKGR